MRISAFKEETIRCYLLFLYFYRVFKSILFDIKNRVILKSEENQCKINFSILIPLV